MCLDSSFGCIYPGIFRFFGLGVSAPVSWTLAAGAGAFLMVAPEGAGLLEVA
jgi:hypothetical protein